MIQLFRKRQIYIKVCHLLLGICLPLVIGPIHFAIAIDGNSLLGEWKEKDGDAVYVFKNNHEFEGTFEVLLSDKTSHRFGAWQTGTELCSSGKTKGNLTIYVGTQLCCHSAFFLGENLILQSIGSVTSVVCLNRVLIKKSPKVAPATVTAEPTDALIQLPTSQSSAVEGSPSAIQSPDFAPYLEKIKRRVESVWDYPEGIAGKHQVSLVFVLDRGGKLVRVEVLDATHSQLDQGVLDAVRKASPFPPIPESLKDLAGWPLRIKFTIDFGLKVAK